MEPVSEQLVSNALTQRLPNNNPSLSTSLLPNLISMESQGEIAKSATTYPLRYQDTAEKIFFEAKALHSSNFHHLSPGRYTSIFDIVKARATFIRDVVSQPNCLQERKKDEIYYAIVVSSSLPQYRLGENLRKQWWHWAWCFVEKRSNSQARDLLTILSA